MGCELVNFIATVILGRIVGHATKAGVLKKTTFKHLMDDLEQTLRVVKNGTLKADVGDNMWVHADKLALAALLKMNVITDDLVPVEVSQASKRKGRPKTKTVQD